MNCFKRLNFLMVLTLIAAPVLAGSAKNDYKVGEHLAKGKAPAVTSNLAYQKLNWDEMLPADWDPMKPLKGLDLGKLKDSDPKAMEALEKAREAWNSAPIVETLNGKRVNIAGFVVPLDIDLDHVKEFLIVPYFGACIHVPPPPSNQVVHIIVPKTLSKAQQTMLKNALQVQDPVEVNGVLMTLPSNTVMGAAGYKMTADLIEAYKAPAK